MLEPIHIRHPEFEVLVTLALVWVTALAIHELFDIWEPLLHDWLAKNFGPPIVKRYTLEYHEDADGGEYRELIVIRSRRTGKVRIREIFVPGIRQDLQTHYRAWRHTA